MIFFNSPNKKVLLNRIAYKDDIITNQRKYIDKLQRELNVVDSIQRLTKSGYKISNIITRDYDTILIACSEYSQYIDMRIYSVFKNNLRYQKSNMFCSILENSIYLENIECIPNLGYGTLLLSELKRLAYQKAKNSITGFIAKPDRNKNTYNFYRKNGFEIQDNKIYFNCTGASYE